MPIYMYVNMYMYMSCMCVDSRRVPSLSCCLGYMHVREEERSLDIDQSV